MKKLERFFEGFLWNSRFVTILAVIASLVTSVVLFIVATADVCSLAVHAWHYITQEYHIVEGMTQEVAKAKEHGKIVLHVIEVVDTYLLATFMLMFSLGIYELFVSDIDQAKRGDKSSNILDMRSLDDLKNRLAKVIIMIIIVKVLEKLIVMDIKNAVDLLCVGGTLACIGVCLYFSHKAESAH